MPATWPDALPKRYRVEGNQEALPDGRLISQTDTGPGKMRPRTSALPRPLSVTMRMNNAQLDIMNAFIAADIGNGALPFIVPAARGAGTWLVRIAQGGMPSWVNVGGDRYNVSIGMEILP